MNSREVLLPESRSVTRPPSALLLPPITPKKSPLKIARATTHLQHPALNLLPRNTPNSKQLKALISGLGFTAEDALEEA